MDFTKDQKKALEYSLDWHKALKKPSMTLGGYAGTGKTTLIAEIRKKLHKENKKLRVSFVSYTGKASRVLRNKLVENNALFDKDFIGTIHSLIYSPIENDKNEIIGWTRKDKIKADLIIIDEASMVDKEIWQDLLFYKIPILAVGDHGQLPPIRGNFNLMAKPDVVLEKIHRQAENNPIIKLSIMARTEGKIKPDSYSDKVKKYAKSDEQTPSIVDDLLEMNGNDSLILCGFNYTRNKINSHIRSKLGFINPTPEINDKVICLRNNHEKDIFNGMTGYIRSIEEHDNNWYYAIIEMQDSNTFFEGLILAEQFGNKTGLNFTKNRYKTLKGDLFDFGYALTVHKAQGSEARRVVLFEERSQYMNDEEWRRWLYTGITRAKEELFIIGD